MMETPSGLPQKSSVIFGNLRKFSENVGNVPLAFGTIKIFGNFRKVVGNLQKVVRNDVIRLSK